MPFLEDFQAYIDAEEKRKTRLDNHIGSGGLPTVSEPTTETTTQNNILSLYGLDPLQQQDREDPKPAPEDMGWGEYVAYDIIGRGLWSFADEFGFGLPGLIAKGAGVEDETLYSQTAAGKMAQGIGTLAGFATGLPMRAGLKVGQMVAKPFLKKAVKEMGEDFVVGSAKKISDDVVGQATKKGMEQEVAESFGKSFQQKVHNSRFNKEVGENFSKNIDDAVDNNIDFWKQQGKIDPDEADQFAEFFKDNFKRRPVQDFSDLWVMRGGNPLAGNIINETIAFGVIDAIRMPVLASKYGEKDEMAENFANWRNWQWSDILWGAGIGAGFGGIKWMMPAPKGKAAPWTNDFVDGAKAILRRNHYQKKSARVLEGHSRLFGDQLDDAGETIIREGVYNGKAYSLNLKSPERLTLEFGEEAAENILKKELNSVVKEEGKKLIKYAITEEGKSLAENWQKMALGSMIMNSRTIYDIQVNDADMQFEDVLPTVLIGAWVNRRGVARRWDISERVDRARGGLRMLGVSTRNLQHIPSFNPHVTSHLDPMNTHEGLRSVKAEAEKMGIMSDNYDFIITDKLGSKDQSVLGADASGDDLSLFHSIHRVLESTGGFVKSKDNISVADAKKLETLVKKLQFEPGYGLKDNQILTSRDFDNVMARVSEQSAEMLETTLLDNIADISESLGIQIKTNKTVIGKLPSVLNASNEVKNLAKEGKLEFLRNEEGEVLNGTAAVEALDTTLRKVESLFELMKGEGGLGRATHDNKNGGLKWIEEPVSLEQLHGKITALESQINQSAGIKGNFKFDFIKDYDNLLIPMINNQAKRAAKGLSTLFDINNPDQSTYQELTGLLAQTGLLRVGAKGKLSIIPNVAKINITGLDPKNADDAAKLAHAKKFLGQVLSIVGAKGQYEVGNIGMNQKDIAYSSIIGNSNRSLSHFLETKGMRTSSNLMDMYNGFVTNYILRDKISKTELTMHDVDYLNGLLEFQFETPAANQFVQFSPGGKGQPAGWKVSKVEAGPGFSDAQIAAVEKYNARVDIIKSNGKGLINVVDSPIVVTNPEVVNALLAKQHFHTQKGRAEVKTVLTQFLNTLEMSHGAFKMMVSQFANDNVSQNPARMMRWLRQYGIVTRETTEGITRYSLNPNKMKGLKPADLNKLMNKMTEFGINRHEAEALQKRAQEEVEDMQFHNYETKSSDQSLTRDQFFQKYIPKSKSTDAQEALLLDVVESVTGLSAPDQRFDAKTQVTYRNPVERLLSKMTLNINGAEIPALEASVLQGTGVRAARAKLAEAIDDAKHLIHSISDKTDKIFITYDNGNVNFVRKQVANTPFLKSVSEMGINMMPILGSNQVFYSKDGGNVRTGRFSIFDADSDYIPAGQKGTDVKAILTEAQNNLSQTLDQTVNFKVSNDPDGAIPIQGEGLVIVKIADSIQPFAIQKTELPIIVENFRQFVKRAEKMDLDPKRLQQIKSDLARLEDTSNPNMLKQEHIQALRTMMVEKLTSSPTDHSFFKDLINGQEPLEKTIKRFQLFHTPAFNYADADFALNSMPIGKYQTDIAKHYANKGTAGVVIWDDKAMAGIRQNMSKENQAFWDDNIGRGDESAFDSVSFISKEYKDYLALTHGQITNSDGRVFKPVISANEDVVIFGKTAFVHDPYLDTFFKNNPDVDILTTKSATKIYGKDQWKLLNKGMDEVASQTNLGSDGFTQQIPLRSIGIKSDRVKDVDKARVSQQLYNYMSSPQAGKIYNELYGPRLEEAMAEFQSVMNDPMKIRSFFNSGVYDDTFVETMLESATGSNKLGSLRTWADFGNPMEIGESVVMSQLYRKMIDPLVSPQSEINGQRYGGKAVLMQSLNPEYRDLKFTKADKDGKIIEHGEIVLPYHEAESSIQILGAKERGLKIKLIDRRNNKIVDVEKVLGDDIGNSFGNLGELHSALSTITLGKTGKARYQIGIVNTRYPRTRPNDLGILGLRGFGSKESGNVAQVNAMDVLNVYEGDYDIDKSDYFWMQSETVFNHINESNHRFIQGIDPDRDLPSVNQGLSDGMYSTNASTENMRWNKQISNSNVLGKGIGLVQKVPRLVNFLRDLADKRFAVDSKGKAISDEHYVLMEGKNLKDQEWEIRVDYNNNDWFQRQVLEAQTIIDAGSHINKEVINSIWEWRDDFLFPLKDGDSIDWTSAKNQGQVHLERMKSGDAGHKRVRIFRKFNKTTGKEEDLSFSDKETIKSLIKAQSDFLQLGTDVYDNTGRGKKPGYDDVMDISDRYFGFMRNITEGSWWSTYSKSFDPTQPKRYRLSNDPDHKHMYNAEEQYTKESLREQENAIKFKSDYVPPLKSYYAPVGAKGPFTQATIDKARAIAEGRYGNVFDRMMYKVWNEDPLKKRQWNVFSPQDYINMDGHMRRFFSDNPQNVDEFTANWMAYTLDLKKSQGTLRYLKRQFGVISKLRIPNKQKVEKIEALNTAIKEIEGKHFNMLSKEYQKTRRAKDLKNIMEYVDLKSDLDMQTGAVQHYTIHALTRIHGTKNTKGMLDDVKELRQFEKMAWADQSDLSHTLQYGDLTMLSNRQREWLGNFPSSSTVNEIINKKLETGLQKHGISFLLEYAAPIAHKNAIGMFNGVPHPVAYGPSKRFDRAMTFLSNKAGSDSNIRGAVSVIAPIIDHYRNYFQARTHQTHREAVYAGGPGASKININYDMLKFPKFQKTLQSGFDSFTAVRWNKATGKENPFQILNDDLLSFYREIFAMGGEAQTFDTYTRQLNLINSSMLSNEHVNPFQYINMMNTLESKAHDFLKKGFTGGISPDGKYIPSDKMKSNPLWLLLGGEDNIKGLSMNPRVRASEYKLRQQSEMSQQAETLLNNPIKEGKMEALRNIKKYCKGDA